MHLNRRFKLKRNVGKQIIETCDQNSTSVKGKRYN
jgi:hypothetical protein